MSEASQTERCERLRFGESVERTYLLSFIASRYLTEVIQLPMTVSVPDGYPLEFPYTTAGGVGTLTLESVLGATGFYTVGGAPSPSPTIADSPIAASGIANFGEFKMAHVNYWKLTKAW